MFEQKKTLGGAVKKYNLSIGSHPNCTITLTPGAGKYKAGTVIKVSVTCSTGWQIGQITWNGTAVANNGTFTMPKVDVTVACTTSQINYTITKSVPSGGGSITCAATAHYNDTVTYSTTPSADWAFSNCALSGSKTQTGMSASGSFVMPAGNVTLTVNFRKAVYTITVKLVSDEYFYLYSDSNRNHLILSGKPRETKSTKATAGATYWITSWEIFDFSGFTDEKVDNHDIGLEFEDTTGHLRREDFHYNIGHGKDTHSTGYFVMPFADIYLESY